MTTAINDTDINELNNELINSLEAPHSDVDLDALFYRSFCFSFCGTEEHSLPWSLGEVFGFPTELAEFNDFKLNDDTSEIPRKRKHEGGDREDEPLCGGRTRISNGDGLLPSLNCLSNVDLQAQRVFEAYQNEHKCRLKSRDRKVSTHARWQSEPIAAKIDAHNKREVFSPCITLPKSAGSPSTSGISVPTVKRYHDNTKSIPNSPSRARLTPRDMNIEDSLVPYTQQSLPSTLQSSISPLLNETEDYGLGISFSPTLLDFGLGYSGSLSDTFQDHPLPTQSSTEPSSTSKVLAISTPKERPPRRRRSRTVLEELPRFISTFPADLTRPVEPILECRLTASSLTSSHDSDGENVTDSCSEDEEHLTPSSPLARFSKWSAALPFSA
ncbi:hypothetical protein E1B28_001733 [Marasmius oreades]|uniref:Uncharacterized protein n=1 Tax=Marasmius oreades TaxID=181124 RepID=A0A9P7V410_9AGAR|nr:uncharacterized protein E1B28_001733 [Marasmius oreades]KAG7099940.1 hypothetical protein E1B28_001733 [Marasmius oreades]